MLDRPFERLQHYRDQSRVSGLDTIMQSERHRVQYSDDGGGLC